MEIEEGGEGNRYNFPSQRKFDTSNIETVLRRQRTDSKCRKIDYLFWFVMVGLLVVSVLHFVIEPLVTPVAHAEGYSNQIEMCSHLTDPALNGTAAKMTLLKLCN